MKNAQGLLDGARRAAVTELLTAELRQFPPDAVFEFMPGTDEIRVAEANGDETLLRVIETDGVFTVVKERTR